MSKPMRIDDHASFAGKGSAKSVLPVGNKVKEFDSAEGAAGMARYEQTSEDIKEVQNKAKAKAKGRPLQPGYRN